MRLLLTSSVCLRKVKFCYVNLEVRIGLVVLRSDFDSLCWSCLFLVCWLTLVD